MWIIRRNGIKNDFFIIRKIHVGQLSFDGYQWEKRETKCNKNKASHISGSLSLTKDGLQLLLSDISTIQIYIRKMISWEKEGARFLISWKNLPFYSRNAFSAFQNESKDIKMRRGHCEINYNVWKKLVNGKHILYTM